MPRKMVDFPELFEQFDPVHFRHFQIGDDKIERLLLDQGRHLFRVGQSGHIKTLVDQNIPQDISLDLFVVND